MGGSKQQLDVALPDHKTAIKHVFEILESVDKPIDGIGHRVVQGGWYFPESKVVTDVDPRRGPRGRPARSAPQLRRG